mmetsp:Transcript_30698/g.59208  ORF Transcript_30698/g.59208 Transcript_30698/m.59208 type:complete len:227 (-) Transcript_30698:207-887(-)|eukprot:CAMPEP_0114277590 /NCGR_PEP_ID=MMETSP0059-20121206/875_1 /TAXON_ID=36894 /ORGANISM="Pyramimonas parkeae, Strain CCMP726" /LENGTH=226 /DNA_ID=CAMNT_0001397713 /DNA_START=85 /DNA_END=765 /DNA_ORIENTATION=+
MTSRGSPASSFYSSLVSNHESSRRESSWSASSSGGPSAATVCTSYPAGVEAPRGKSASTTTTNLKEPSYGIHRSNVGYALLKRAGWVEGKGLGAEGQGRHAPLLPNKRPDRKGLGAIREGEHERSRDQVSQSKPSNEQAALGKRKLGTAAEVPTEARVDPQEIKRRERAHASHAKQRARDRAIQRQVYSAFHAPEPVPRDDNPILRSRRAEGNLDGMSSSNPLRFL